MCIRDSDGPHDGIRAAQRLHRAAQRHDVGVVAAFDGALRADLDAGVTLPALLRLLVEGFHGMAGFGTVLVEFHQVVRADVHAGGLVLPLAAIALLGTNKSWHLVSYSQVTVWITKNALGKTWGRRPLSAPNVPTA